MEGTYPLPEAQRDRFLFEVAIPSPGVAEMVEIVERTTGEQSDEVETVLSPARIAELRRTVRRVIAPAPVLARAARIVAATGPDSPGAPALVVEAVRHGGGVRALQAAVLGAKVRALRAGRLHVADADIDASLAPALRHRLVLSLEGEARGIPPEEIIAAALERAGGGG
jgi:MoxR-like ATPase